MKLKENKGMSLIVFTIILAVLVVLAGGIIIYLLINPVKEGTTIQTPTGIQNNMNNNEIEIYTETDQKDIKATIENYYKLLTAKENSPVLMLTDVMKMTVYAVQDPEYAPDNYVEHPDASKYMWTGIKYEDFRNNLWYVTDDILKEKFSEFVEYKNYLYIDNNDNEAYEFKYEITKQEINQSSTIETCICDVTVKNSKTGKITDSKITMSRGNGDFVIVSVNNSNVNVVDNKETNLVVINDEPNINAEGKICEYISEEGNSAEVPVEISYIVNGNNKGNLQIKYNNKVVYTKKAEKNIIEFNRIKDAFDSDIFVLYEDGTVGKISISNIKNNKYDIVKVENCENIVRIQELVFEYEASGADYALVAVDGNGKIVTLATYSV